MNLFKATASGEAMSVFTRAVVGDIVATNRPAELDVMVAVVPVHIVGKLVASYVASLRPDAQSYAGPVWHSDHWSQILIREDQGKGYQLVAAGPNWCW